MPLPKVFPLTGSRLGRFILVLHMSGFLILAVGALILNEFRRSLIEARLDSLSTQSQLLAYVIESAATEGDPFPRMNSERAIAVLNLLTLPSSERARLYDAKGFLLADSDIVADKVISRTLPSPGWSLKPFTQNQTDRDKREMQAHFVEQAEVRSALKGQKVVQVREAETGGRLVSVSIPLKHVKKILGVLTVEASGVDEIVAAQRRSLIPFIIIAAFVIVIASFLLDKWIAKPILKLARMADGVRLSKIRTMSLPDMVCRKDEIGDLAIALESMTKTLSARLDAIEHFAADVAHEIKNPLTSLRSALETLEVAPAEGAGRDKLMAILKSDVMRMNRLITDIAYASHIDTNLSRTPSQPVALISLLRDVVSSYDPNYEASGVAIIFDVPDAPQEIWVKGQESPFGQVFRNLIDNARSFSPEKGRIWIRIVNHAHASAAKSAEAHAAKSHFDEIIVCIEDEGPGIPEDSLEAIFMRFYTARPNKQPFGGHSGLGLSIARQILEAHGGKIFAENRLDADGKVVGARFSAVFVRISS